MNTKNIVAALVAALSVGSSFAAAAKTNVITIAGSTAYRDAAVAALESYYNGGSNAIAGWSLVARSGDGSTATKDTYRLYAQGTTNFIAVHWTGSEGGLQALANNANVKIAFLPLTANTTNTGVGAATLSTNVTIAFADVKQAASRFNGKGATDLGDSTKYAALPAPVELANLGFVWAASSNWPATAPTNITKEIEQELFANGNVPLARFTGNSSDTAKVYLVGRNPDSGTRCAALLNAGLQNTAPVQQNAVDANGIVTPYPAETVIGLNCATGMSGYSSGGSVSTALKNVSTNSYYAVGYVGRSDFGAGNTMLNHEGAVLNAANIITGAYPFWTTENLYTMPKPSTTVTAVAANLAAFCKSYNAASSVDATGKYVNLDDMKVKRSVDAGTITVK
jgi:hypothetical protein